LLDRHRGDAGERGLGDRATQEPRLLLALRLPAPSENRSQQAGLLVHLAGQLRQALRILEILDPAVVEATDVQLALARLALEQLPELDPLLRGHAPERLRSGLLILLGRRLPRDGPVSLENLLVRVAFPRRSLLEPLQKGLVLLPSLRTTQQRIEKAHDSFLLSRSGACDGRRRGWSLARLFL